MTITEIRKIEENRKDTLDVVHLIKEGSFYHANDWSAWLMTTYPIGEAVHKPMVVTAKKLKDDYLHAFVGFPTTSLAKYVPNDGSVEFRPISDNQIDVVLNIDFDQLTTDQIRHMVDEWKENLPLRESKKQHREDKDIINEATRITRISDVIAKIISLPMEEISPKQAYDILRDLRKQISALF